MLRRKPSSRRQITGLCLAVVGLIWIWGAGQVAGQIVINEILADPASDWDHDGEVDYKADEWVEVTNLGTDPVDLSAYWLRDELGEDPHLNLFGVIDPGEAIAFCGSAATAWQQENGQSTVGLSLNNGGDTVVLLRTMAKGEVPVLEVVDSVVYADHEADDDRSSGWDESGSVWVLFDALNPYPGTQDPPGTDCAPTPNEPNSCKGLVPDDATSFGSLKATFR